MNDRLLQIRSKLGDVEEDFLRTQEIKNDPLSNVLNYGSPVDREVAAFIASVFSYGNVKQIQNTLDQVFAILGETPAQALKKNSGSDWKKKIPSTFKHRFNTAQDLGCLLTWLGEALRRSETLEDFFIAQQETEKIE